jgi:glycosyltransferase involved in cell wall biosynthesis
LALISIEYPPFLGGGIGTYAYHLCRLLGESGHRVSVFSLTQEGDIPDLPNVTVHLIPEKIPMSTGSFELDWLAENLRRGQWLSERLAEIHATQPLDIIELTDYFMDDFPLDTSPLVRQDGKPVPIVTHFHGPHSLAAGLDGVNIPLIAQLEEIIFTESPFRKTYSPKMRDQVNQLWPGADCQFIPAPFFLPKSDRDSAFTESDQAFEFDLLYFGRMERRKGVEKFAQALKILTAEGVLPRVCFVGGDTSTSPTGNSMAEWLERELRPPLGAKLHLRERMPQEKLWALLPRARVLVIPSLWESLGYVILEAACSGRPVIFSQEAGGTYILKGKLKDRSLVDVRDPKTFAAKLRQVLVMPEEELVSWGRQLNEAVQKEFHPDRVLKHTVQYYQSCMEAAATAKAPGGAHQREFLLSCTKKFIDMAQGRNDDYIRLGNENQKLWNENQQIWNENQKIWKENQQIWEEKQQIWDEKQQLGNEHQKLGNEHQKLWNEHQQLGNEKQQLGNEKQQLWNDKQQIWNEYQQLLNEYQKLLMWQRAITSTLIWRIAQRLWHSPLGRLAALISQRLGRQ